MKKVLKILLSFSKAERIGLAVLLLLIVLLITLPFIIPERKASSSDINFFKHKIDSLSKVWVQPDNDESNDLPDYQKNYKGTKFLNEKKYNLFVFDPNTASEATFEQLGFSPKQATAIVNYRSRGALFRTADDFKKVFVVSDEMYERLKPYINIDIAKLPVKEMATKYDSSSRFRPNVKEKIELNSADTALLRTVRGVGAYTATQIVNYREQLGGFASIDQLLEIKGMTEERLEQIVPQITLDIARLTPIDLRTADEAVLKQHPYIGAYDARGIIRFRKSSATCSLDELVKNNVLKTAQAEKLRPYCKE